MITFTTYDVYTAISIKVVHEQSGKAEYERERLLGIANKLMNFQSVSQQPFALAFDFSALLVDNLN
jgi:transcriptional regulator NrdR family protein